VSSHSFDASLSDPSTPHQWAVPGVIHNTNTIEGFNALKTRATQARASFRLLQDILDGSALKEPCRLAPFFLLTFADLKKHMFTYWFAFPSFSLTWLHHKAHPRRNGPVQSLTSNFVPSDVDSIEAGLATLSRDHGGQPPIAFLIWKNEVQPLSYEGWKTADATTIKTDLYLGVVDPSGRPEDPGWTTRNALLLVAHHLKLSSIRVLCLRDRLLPKREIDPSQSGSSQTGISQSGSLEFEFRRTDVTRAKSIVFEVELPPLDLSSLDPSNLDTEAVEKAGLKPVGFEKNSEGKLAPKRMDLSALMDPHKLMESAVDLNLKLLMWRQLPDLKLDTLVATKVLLLGSGTLGCNVARTLMGWGVRNLTFVDNGKVSFSNPLRQPLFDYEDCLGGGKFKAVAAAERVKRIFPGMQAGAEVLSIPMPGHPFSNDAAAAQGRKDIDRLTDLIKSHDVVFLLTDTRESRWLPTVVAASEGKPLINAALGMDSFLVMRHGAPTALCDPSRIDNAKASGSAKQPRHLGCYFCNDVIAPVNSVQNRSLDQQCTVTRPGVAPIASNLAVELFVALLHEPLGIWTPADHLQADMASSGGSNGPSNALGLVPHTVRGFLAQYRMMAIEAQAFDKCSACSSSVLDAYRQRGTDFVMEACNAPATFLEDVSGLTEMRKQTEAMDLDCGFDFSDDED
jgi:ubiquitin-like modifier-activating enzyme ATG7